MRDTEERFVARVSTRDVPPALCLALLFALGCARGQDLQSAQACTSLTDDAARLSCYDAALRVAKSTAGPAGSPVSPPAATTGPLNVQGTFGDDGRLHTRRKPDVPKNLTAQVREVVPLANGLYRLTLDNGQIWDTTEADSAVAFNANDAVSISRGLFNSYRISLTGRTPNVSAARKK